MSLCHLYCRSKFLVLLVEKLRINQAIKDQSGLTDIKDFVWFAINPSTLVIPVNFPSNYRYYNIYG